MTKDLRSVKEKVDEGKRGNRKKKRRKEKKQEKKSVLTVYIYIYKRN